eukprot:TRINITY_DN2154_c0_g1_i2.p1 TRINITY_DN2154_c0_g1~~TRINITY_DN2154_c0_g1_i2.p1  ORF type:complete len:987 (+),score=166.88 TRINITY_DN2154_c0_g1_i2:61-2961(+)
MAGSQQPTPVRSPSARDNTESPANPDYWWSEVGGAVGGDGDLSLWSPKRVDRVPLDAQARSPVSGTGTRSASLVAKGGPPRRRGSSLRRRSSHLGVDASALSAALWKAKELERIDRDFKQQTADVSRKATQARALLEKGTAEGEEKVQLLSIAHGEEAELARLADDAAAKRQALGQTEGDRALWRGYMAEKEVGSALSADQESKRRLSEARQREMKTSWSDRKRADSLALSAARAKREALAAHEAARESDIRSRAANIAALSKEHRECGAEDRLRRQELSADIARLSEEMAVAEAEWRDSAPKLSTEEERALRGAEAFHRQRSGIDTSFGEERRRQMQESRSYRASVPSTSAMRSSIAAKQAFSAAVSSRHALTKSVLRHRRQQIADALVLVRLALRGNSGGLSTAAVDSRLRGDAQQALAVLLSKDGELDRVEKALAAEEDQDGKLAELDADEKLEQRLSRIRHDRRRSSLASPAHQTRVSGSLASPFEAVLDCATKIRELTDRHGDSGTPMPGLPSFSQRSPLIGPRRETVTPKAPPISPGLFSVRRELSFALQRRPSAKKVQPAPAMRTRPSLRPLPSAAGVVAARDVERLRRELQQQQQQQSSAQQSPAFSRCASSVASQTSEEGGAETVDAAEQLRNVQDGLDDAIAACEMAAQAAGILLPLDPVTPVVVLVSCVMASTAAEVFQDARDVIEAAEHLVRVDVPSEQSTESGASTPPLAFNLLLPERAQPMLTPASSHLQATPSVSAITFDSASGSPVAAEPSVCGTAATEPPQPPPPPPPPPLPPPLRPAAQSSAAVDRMCIAALAAHRIASVLPGSPLRLPWPADAGGRVLVPCSGGLWTVAAGRTSPSASPSAMRRPQQRRRRTASQDRPAAAGRRARPRLLKKRTAAAHRSRSDATPWWQKSRQQREQRLRSLRRDCATMGRKQKELVRALSSARDLCRPTISPKSQTVLRPFVCAGF